jgi:lipoprotein NlpD
VKTWIAAIGAPDPCKENKRPAAEVYCAIAKSGARDLQGFSPLRIVSWVLLLVLLGGCGFYRSSEDSSPRRRGVYHTVRRGETLWRISRDYRMDIEQIAVLNGISNPDRLIAGVRIFIPGAWKTVHAKKRRRVAPPRSRPPRIRPRWAAPKNSDKGRSLVRGPGRKGAVKFKWPLKGKVLRRFGTRRGVKSDGIDIGAPRLTTIRAAAGGRVIFSNWGPGGTGRTVIIRHKGGAYHSVYSHNEVNLVKPGEQVVRGAPIARLGSTGAVQSARLHFEIRYRTKPRNPLSYLP